VVESAPTFGVLVNAMSKDDAEYRLSGMHDRPGTSKVKDKYSWMASQSILSDDYYPFQLASSRNGSLRFTVRGLVGCMSRTT
jgi:hypothetical protein